MALSPPAPDPRKLRAPPREGRAAGGRIIRILLSEGASTSAREAVTALGLAGHTIEVCDPDPRCLTRFSRLVTRFHRCPGLGRDPAGYLAFVLDLLASGRFDVLLPIHEQGFLFARALDRIRPLAAVALPAFESYARVHDKAAFSRLLDELGLPQPRTRVLEDRTGLHAEPVPFVLKAAIGTASRGTWIIRTGADLAAALRDLEAVGGTDDALLVQDLAEGAVEHAQAVFCEGRLLGFHAYRQAMRGAGGGDAVKESIRRPVVRAHMERIGERLAWHGALSLDYILDAATGVPLYIDGNPRLVEPLGAAFAGLDLMDLLLRVSCGERPSPARESPAPGPGEPVQNPDLSLVRESREGVRSHLAIQVLLGHILAGGTRATLIREIGRLLTKRGPYAGSREELTPVRLDWPSAMPGAVTALWLLADPRAALYLPRRGWGTHLLNPESVRTIRHMGAQLSQATA
ncbi:MAG: hypothetical protein M3158_01180 [Pseudomonadota bacterium]|nr:hypothetical protein [Pseudomonadota bacterium]